MTASPPSTTSPPAYSLTFACLERELRIGQVAVLDLELVPQPLRELRRSSALAELTHDEREALGDARAAHGLHLVGGRSAQVHEVLGQVCEILRVAVRDELQQASLGIPRGVGGGGGRVKNSSSSSSSSSSIVVIIIIIGQD